MSKKLGLLGVSLFEAQLPDANLSPSCASCSHFLAGLLLISDAISSLSFQLTAAKLTHPQHCYQAVSLASSCAVKREKAGPVYEEGCVVLSSLRLLACGSNTNNAASRSEFSLLKCLSGGEVVKTRRYNPGLAFCCAQTSPWFLLLQQTVTLQVRHEMRPLNKLKETVSAGEGFE